MPKQNVVFENIKRIENNKTQRSNEQHQENIYVFAKIKKQYIYIYWKGAYMCIQRAAICACYATVTVSWFWCMTTRHGFVHNITKKELKQKIALENNTTRWMKQTKKKMKHTKSKQLQYTHQPNMRILSCQSSLTGYMMTTTRNERIN